MPEPSPDLFDQRLIALRRARAQRAGAATFLLDRVIDDFDDRLAVVLRRFERAVDIGTPTAALRERLAIRVGVMPAVDFLTRPQEALGLSAGAHDLAVSALALQFANDLPGVLAQIRRALRPDGLLLAALIGGETLSELRQALAMAESEITGGLSPRVAPLADLRDVGALLQRAGFTLPVVDVDRVIVRYDHIIALMHDLRAMAATNALTERRRMGLSRAVLARAGAVYAERFADPDGRIRATFDIIWLSGWAAHESQQKPLAPGSATTRLADVLPDRASAKRSGTE